jgi:glycogen synthase
VIGIVSRFAEQKGFDLVEQIAGRLSETGCGRGGAGLGRAGL